ncbi:dicarboxylate/amino acid:cation symporter [Rubrivirga litoralis]|uniref:Dicarboxylate/amino acid:cation symporter n=1 Tax=Rubrivirga litoralis TaxID=3075598 RepID=A0ABU3BMH7_9BACT|nr:dicarboxylate/amino acid:cation symporter [Rubrivirga sp. F394]MDT0630491.1 dicarboxylate/amino acid:cation symporter [Rubrivirga sp. F394]
MPWYRKLHWQIILGLLLGLGFGVVAAAEGWGPFVDAWVQPFGTIFITALKLIAVPLVLASLITGVASLSDLRKLSRIGGKTIGIYMVTTAIAVTLGVLLADLIQPGKAFSPALRDDLVSAFGADSQARVADAAAVGERGPLQFLVDAVPENVFAAFGDNANMLQVVVVALLLGIGLVQVPKERGAPVLAFFEGLNDVVIRLVDLVMLLAPIGVFALLADTIVSVAGDDPGRILSLLSGLGWYCFVVLLGLGLHTVVVYPTLLRLFTPIGLKTFFQGIGPAQLVAFSTSSSGATLPVTMERCEEKLGVSEEVSSFVLPLGATINMDGTALYQAVATLFIAQAFSLDLGLGAQVTIVLTAVLASIGTAAVPGAGIIMLVIILEAVGVPAAGIALILGVDRILDMCRTVANVTGDATVATVIAASEGQLRPPDLSEDRDRVVITPPQPAVA